MSRRRFVYREVSPGVVKSFEVGQDFTGADRRAQTVTEELVYGGLRATDGADISSRKKHREYKHVNGYADADDYKGQWDKAAKERADFYITGGDHKGRREAIERAMYQLTDGRRNGRR